MFKHVLKINTIMFCLGVVICALSLSGLKAEASPEKQKSPDFQIDKENQARIHFLEMPIVPSVGGRFEFFTINLKGQKERSYIGPWKGDLKGKFQKVSNKEYKISTANSKSGIEYKVSYFKVDDRTIDLHFDFSVKTVNLHFSYEILKLSGELFKGAKVFASPSMRNEKNILPLSPAAVSKRFLYSKKKHIVIESAIGDIEVSVLGGGADISIADFRNISWDKQKSFYFWGSKKLLIPGKKYHLAYRIKFNSPLEFRKIEQEENTCDINAYEKEKLFAFTPKIKEKKPGVFKLERGIAVNIFSSEENIAKEILLKELKKKNFEINETSHPGEKGIFLKILQLENDSDNFILKEGYRIEIKPDRVLIEGRDQTGCLYGVYTFLDMLQPELSNHNWFSPCVILTDWPTLPIRGMCIELLAPAIKDIKLFKKYLELLSLARTNLIIFYHSPYQIKAWKENFQNKGWTIAEIKEISQYAKSLGMEVWAGMSTKFSPKQFPELNIMEGSTFYDPKDSSSYRLLFDYYRLICEIYNPSTLIVGHDEIKGLSLYAEKYNESSSQLLKADIKRIYEFLSEKGVSIGIWGDMLLDSHIWEERVGNAHSKDGLLNSGSTHQIIDDIPKTIKIIDWHYRIKENYPSIKYFRDRGFEVYGCVWHEPETAKNMAKSIFKFAGNGIIGSDWGFWRTLSPAASTLYSSICGWDNDCSISKCNIDTHTVSDYFYKFDTKNYRQLPVSIDALANKSTLDKNPVDSYGIFDVGSSLDFSSLPTGNVKFSGITFIIRSPENGTMKNCVVIGSDKRNGKELPAETVLQINQTLIHSIGILHTCFVDSPQYRPRNIGEYIVKYDDGSSSSIKIIEGYNITDVRSSEGFRKNSWHFVRTPDVLLGSKLAWRGQSKIGLPLNLQMIVWENPFPSKKIEKIIFRSKKIGGASRIAILGLTLMED